MMLNLCLTVYKSSRTHGFLGKSFCVFPIVSIWELNDIQDGVIFDPRGMTVRIYVEHHITLYKLGVVWFQRFFHVPLTDIHAYRSVAYFGPMDMVSRIYKENH